MELNLHVPKLIAYFLRLHLLDELIQDIGGVWDKGVVYCYSWQNLNKMNKIIQSCLKHREIHVSLA